MKNKKALAMQWYFLAIGLAAGLTIFFYQMAISGSPISGDYIGHTQIKIINTFQKAEKALFYLDQSAKYAATNNIMQLASNGGHIISPCGKLAGYNVLIDNQKNDGDCLPDFYNNFKKGFAEDLDSYLMDYSAVNFPLKNYDIILDQKDKLSIIGKANNKFTIFISGGIENTEYKSIKEEVHYEIPKNADSMVSKVMVYGIAIQKQAERNSISAALLSAVIAQESSGNPNAVSPTGCKGLMQFCGPTAYDYGLCDCVGEDCKKTSGDRKFCVKKDERFDPEKSIEAGAKYLYYLKNRFRDYSYAEEFALASYNGGESVIKKAIKKTGKSNPTWNEVAEKITADLITYFSEEEDRKDKVSKITDYVKKVTGYKIKFEEAITKGSAEFDKIAADAKEEEPEQENKEKTHDCCFCPGECGHGCYVESVSTAYSCGHYSVGKGVNCEMSYCIATNVYGKYSIFPSFRTQVDYDFSDYDNILVRAKVIFEKCKETGDINSCINEEIKEINNEDNAETEKFTWTRDCDSPEKKFLNEFIDLYAGCANQPVESGICSFNIPKGPPNTNIKLRISNSGKVTKFELMETEYSELASIEGPYHMELKRIEEKTFDLQSKGIHPSIIIKIAFDKDGIPIITSDYVFDHKSINLYYNRSKDKISLSILSNPLMDSILIQKNTNKNAKFLFDFDLYPIQEIFRMCVKTDNKLLWFYEKNQKSEFENINYKFAFRITDTIPPPPRTGMEVLDHPGKDNSVLVLWDKDDTEDIKNFHVFYSKSDMSDGVIEDGELVDLVTNEKADKKSFSLAEKITINEIDLNNCVFEEDNKPCKFEGYDKIIEGGQLYYLPNNEVGSVKKEKYLVRITGISDDEEYYYMIVAEDFNGNIRDNFEGKEILADNKVAAVGKSKDNLRPLSVDNLQIGNYYEGRLNLLWPATAQNQDGSVAEDIENFWIYYLPYSDYIGNEIQDKKDFLINELQDFLIIEPQGSEIKCESSPADDEAMCSYALTGIKQRDYLIGVVPMDESENGPNKIYIHRFSVK